MKSEIIEMKNTAEGVNSTSNDTVEKAIELEDKVMEITEAEQNKKRKQSRTVERNSGTISSMLSFIISL